MDTTYFTDIGIILSIPHGRSGSVFMQSLFDSHPEVISFPYIYDLYHFDIEKIYYGNKKELINIFIDRNSHLFSTHKLVKMGMTYDKQRNISHKLLNIINIEEFKSNFIELTNNIEMNSNKIFFITIHLALAKTLNYKLAKIKYIYVHLHDYNNKNLLDFLIFSFSNLFFIPLIRDPRESWNSSKKLWRDKFPQNSDTDNFFEYLAPFIKRYDGLFTLIRKISDNSRILIVDLNTLHKYSNQAMILMAKKLKIKYDELLCKSTILGVQWQGNSSDEINYSSFDIKKSNFRWKEELSQNEVYILELLLKNIFYILGYQTNKDKLNFLSLFWFIFFYKSMNLKNIKFNNLTLEDKYLLSNLKEKRQIKNIKYKYFPLFIAKSIIYIHMVFNRFKKNNFNNKRYSISMYLEFYKLNKKYKRFRLEKELFL